MRQRLFILGVVFLAVKESMCRELGTAGEADKIKNVKHPERERKVVSLKNNSGLGFIMSKLGKYIKNEIVSALKPVSTNLSHSYFNDDSEDRQSDLFPSTDQPISELHMPTLKKSEHSTYTGLTGKILSIDSIRPSFIPYAGGVAEVTMDTSSIPKKKTALETGFYKSFKKNERSMVEPEKFVKKGILNAKKNLLIQTRLARAYASAAAQKTVDVFENTLRSSHLLSDLVKKGLVTPYSAAKELALSVKDVASEYIDASARNMKGASNYLLETAVESVDGIVNGLKESPTAVNDLLKSYESILKNPKFNFHLELPSLTASLEMDVQRLKEFLKPHSPNPMGNITESMLGTIDSLKRQWSRLENSFFGEKSELYKEKFLKITENLAYTLDALRSRLGKGARLQVPGMDALRFRFKSVLDELKKRNNLTISGNVSFRKLMDYSMGVFSQLKEIDKAILGLAPLMEEYFDSSQISNPMRSLSGFNKMSHDALDSVKAYTGIKGLSFDGSCVGRCLR